jgi:hypothetical protein
MAHYPAYGAQREGRVPGQPASVVMGGLDTISAGSGVGQPQAASPTDPNRPRGAPQKLLGLSVWVQRLRGVPAPGGGGSISPTLEQRALEARADAIGGATPGPRLPLGLERLPPGVPLFGALRGLAATRVEGNLQPGVAKQAVQETPEEPNERPGDAGSAHEGGETPRPEDGNESIEKPKAAPPIREAPALPNIPNQARGSGPSASGPVFLGGVKHSTDTASRSVEGPSEHAGGGGAGPNPPPNLPANPASASQRSHPRSRSTNAYGQGLARRYGLADAIREQQEAAAVRKWMSKGSGSGSHAFKASNGTGASGGGGTGPSVELGAPSPSVAHPPHFGEGSQHTGNEALRGGGSLGDEGGKASSQDRGALQNRNGWGGGEMGARGLERELPQAKGDGRVPEDRANHLRANAAARGFGTFGSLREGSAFDGAGRSSQGLQNGLGEGQSADGSGGSKNQSGGKRGMGAWIKRLGIGQAARGSGNQTNAQDEDQRGGNGEPNDGTRGKGEGAAGNLKLGGGRDVETGLGSGDEAVAQRSGAPALEPEGNKGGLKGAGVFAEQGGAEPRGEGQKRVVVERRQTGGLSFLPSFKAPPPLVIPGAETAAEFLNEGLEVQDVADAGELDAFRTPSGHSLDTFWTLSRHYLVTI